MITTDVAALARDIADAAAKATLACALTPMPGSDGWMSTLLPHGASLDEVRDVRRALRYLHLRGLITDHAQRPWVRLAPPNQAAPRKRGRPAAAPTPTNCGAPIGTDWYSRRVGGERA